MSFLTNLLKMTGDEERVSVASLNQLIEQLNQSNQIDQHITHMLKGVLSINELRARDLMVPRAYIDYFYDSDNLVDVLDKVLEYGHSRYPVLSDEQESIGLLFAKDLIKVLSHTEDLATIKLKDIVKPIAIIPESKRVTTLLKEFQSQQRHLALVVNEFEEISGLITIEDILEEIVGDISDEYDKAEIEIYQVNKTTFNVLATTEITTFNEVFKTNLESEEFDTIGGYIVNMLGRVPQRNDSFELGAEGISVRVIQANNRMLNKIRVRLQNGREQNVNLDIPNVSSAHTNDAQASAATQEQLNLLAASKDGDE